MSLDSMPQTPSPEDQIKALEIKIEEANASFDGELAGTLEAKKKELERQLASPENHSVAQIVQEGDPVKLAELDAQYTVDRESNDEEAHGPDKQGHFDRLNNSERRNEITMELKSETESLVNLLKDSSGEPAAVARSVRGIMNNLDRMWQPRVRRELAYMNDFYSEEYRAALATPEAQAIYDEEVGKIISSAGDPALAPLLQSLKDRDITQNNLDSEALAETLINNVANKKVDSTWV